MADEQAPPDPAADARKALTPLEMTVDEVSEWKARIETSLQRVKNRETEWDTLAKEYTPSVSDQAQAGDVKSNTHFRNTHTKIGQLFVRSPKVILKPKGPGLERQVLAGPDGLPMEYSPADAVATRQAVLNYYLGPDEIDAVRLMDLALMDMQMYSGIAAVLVEYRSTTRMVQQPVLAPDPMFQPNPLSIAPQPPPMVPQIDPLTGQPQMQSVPVIIHEQWCAERLSPKKVLLDDLLRSSEVRKHARWVGRRNQMSKREAIRRFSLSEEEAGRAGEEDDRIHQYDEDSSGSPSVKNDMLWYTEIWYRAMFFTDEDHPDKIHHLIFFDSVQERPVVHEPWKCQEFDDQGKLTPNSLREFPIHIGSLRDAIDTPYPKADAAFTQALVKQLNTFLQQSVKLRDAAIGKYFYDTEVIDAEDLYKLKNGEIGTMIGLKSGALGQGADKIFYTTAQVKASPDDWRAIGLLKSYMDETLGISATQAGAMTDTVRSATEIQQSSAAASGRQQKEQARVVDFFLRIARMVDQLVFRYATGDRWVQVAGPGGNQKLMMWNKVLGGGEYTYDIEPDSQLSIDAARDRQQKIAAYNVLAPDPLFRRVVAIRDIARLCGWDPGEAVIDEVHAQAQAAAQAEGAPVGQPPHGGGPVNKHVQERSGGAQNAPGSAGSNRQERNPPPPGQAGRPTP